MENNFEIINGVLIKYLGDDSTVEIPETVTEIGEAAFYENQYISTVVLPKTVKKLGSFAFFNCSNLKKINIQYVEEICDSALSGCEKITDVELNPGLKSIGHQSFYGVAIEKIVIPGTVKTIGEQAFVFCDNLKLIIISEGCEKVGSSAFECHGGVSREIWIPKTLHKFGNDAFKNKNYSGYGWNNFYGPKNEFIFNIISEEEFKTDNNNFLMVISTAEERKQKLSNLKDELDDIFDKMNPLMERRNGIIKERDQYRKENEKILKRKLFKGRQYRAVTSRIRELGDQISKLYNEIRPLERKKDGLLERCTLLEKSLDPARQKRVAKEIISEIEEKLRKKKHDNLDEHMYVDVYPLVEKLYEIGYPYANKYEAIVLWCEESIYFFSNKEKNQNRAWKQLGFGPHIAKEFRREYVGVSLYMEQQAQKNAPQEVWVDIDTGLPM